MKCDLCKRPAFVKMLVEGPGASLCIDHIRIIAEILLFIAREGAQQEADIDQHLARFEELYPFPKRIV